MQPQRRDEHEARMVVVANGRGAVGGGRWAVGGGVEVFDGRSGVDGAPSVVGSVLVWPSR